MTDPVRLRDSDAQEIRDLLRHGTVPRAMTSEERRRTQRRVLGLSGAVAGLGMLFWVKGLALGACLGAVVVAGHVAVERAWVAPAEEPPSAPALPSHGAGVPSRAPTSASDAAADREEDAPSEAASPARPPKEANTASKSDVLAAELELLQRAQAALAHNPAIALSLTEEHASRFPRGQLGMEREIVAIEALRKLGRRAEANTRAEALLRRAKGSLYEERVRNLVNAP